VLAGNAARADELGGAGAVAEPPAAPVASDAHDPAEPSAAPLPVDDVRSNKVHWAPPVLHATALFTVMRISEAFLWPEPFARTDPSFWAARYKEAYTRPPKFEASRPFMQWDGDPWPVNVIGHGLLGSELHLRARRCGFGVLGSLAFATGASAVWEYVFEANGVRPSALDLVYTPLAGLVLGEARFALLGLARGDSARERVFRAVLDPFGEAERALGTPC
jgi:hypothetical protein